MKRERPVDEGPPGAKVMKALVIIPAFNEGVKLEETARRIRESFSGRADSVAIDVMIVDDGSTDADIQRVSEKFHFFLIRNPEQKGVGYSIRRAYEYGCAKDYDILITMAGNNKDEPRELNRLMEPIVKDEADFVQGSRYLPGGNFGNMPAYRLLATRFLHPWIFSFISGKRITDSTNGFRAVRASVLRDRRLRLDPSWLDHYELEPYLFCQAIRMGYRVTEVPVSKVYPDKKLGYSKMRPFVDWWSILRPLFFLWFRSKK
ncbi:MAG TPA: glycosyltransferase family 2 protein [Candidatus Omnitrophota bacterium]|nr:glycosyltransferase family 2 protein [Candidatus Omnitrophota bacterium]